MTHDECYALAKKIADIRMTHDTAAKTDIDPLLEGIDPVDRNEAQSMANAIVSREKINSPVKPVGP